MLDLYHRDEFSRGLSLRLDKIDANADARVAEFDIRTSVGRRRRPARCPAVTSRRS